MKKYLKYAAAPGAAAAAILANVPAVAQVTLPDPGVDVADYVTLAIAALGVTVAAVVGGYIAFLIIRKGMRWGGSFAR